MLKSQRRADRQAEALAALSEAIRAAKAEDIGYRSYTDEELAIIRERIKRDRAEAMAVAEKLGRFKPHPCIAAAIKAGKLT